MTKYLYYPFVVLGRAIMHPVDYVGRIRKLCRDFRLPYDLMRRIVKLGGEEYRDEVDFISRQKSPRWFPFPYPAVRDEMARVNAFVKDGLPAIRHKTKDLFFRRTTSLREVRRQYRTFIDQEGITGCGCLAKCPHNYQSAEHRVEKGDVLLDIGCSEAIFTLDNLEKVSEAYVFEADEEWKEPLSHTFPVDKVHVVTKFVGDKTGGDECSCHGYCSFKTGCDLFHQDGHRRERANCVEFHERILDRQSCQNQLLRLPLSR